MGNPFLLQTTQTFAMGDLDDDQWFWAHNSSQQLNKQEKSEETAMLKYWWNHLQNEQKQWTYHGADLI